MQFSWKGCAGALVCIAGAFPVASVHAQDKWPTKPVRLVVPFTPAAASDVLARIVGQRLSEMHGQQIVADNRPGAGGLIGSELTKQAAPDGYTLTMVGQPHLSNALMRSPMPYDPLKDFTPVALVANTYNVMVLGKGVNVKTIPELIALAKSKPGALNYGSAGVGSSSHLAGALFTSKAGVDIVHVPFRQGGDSRSALIGGTIHLYVYPLPAILGPVKAGQIRALAVGSATRAEALPDVPTTAEAGFGQYMTESWFGIIGPRGLNPQFVTRLNADINAILKEPAIREKVVLQGARPGEGPPEAFAKVMQNEYTELSTLIKKIGMKLN